MAVTYFGNNDDGAGQNPFNASWTWFLVVGYTCPGTGLQNLITLDININTVDTGNIRMAIYDTVGNFIAQWDDQYTPGGTGWFAKTSFVDEGEAPINPQLTGGVNYILAATQDGAGSTHSIKYDTVGENTVKYVTSDYTEGFPDPIVISSPASDREFCFRAGVEPAAAGGSIVPILLSTRMRKT